MLGTHLIADLYDCQTSAPCLTQADALESLCLASIDHAGLTRLSSHFHQFHPEGATGMVILAESHLAIHTWPELRRVTLDVFVCNHTRDNTQRAYQVYQSLESAFEPLDRNLQILERPRSMTTNFPVKSEATK